MTVCILPDSRISEEPLLTTLGLFIIDENEYPASSRRKSERDIIGGGGSYAIVGGRIAAGAALGKYICGIADKGTDFPPEIEIEISQWDTGIIFRETKDRLTSRGVNIYGEDGVRRFVYKTPKKRIVAEDIVHTSNLLLSRCFHFCCSVERCEETIDIFLTERSSLKNPPSVRPKFIFEPDPRACTSASTELLHKILHKVDVFTPNLHEAAQFYNIDKLPETTAEIEALASRFLKFTSADGGVVLRCGHMGCFVKTHDLAIMLPAFHNNQEKVVDVTGGGNSFCGAFITALEISGDWIAAGIVGNIASGIVIERLGMPLVTGNIWNGISFNDRISEYLNTNKDLLAGFDSSVINWL